MNKHLIILLAILVSACTEVKSQDQKSNITKEEINSINNKTDEFYQLNVNDSIKSISSGTVSNGTLKNSTLLPFHSHHLTYFDRFSYLEGRGFMHNDVAKIINQSFINIKNQLPDRTFYLMECSSKHGGKLHPHRTHQNGMSVDIMSPKLKNGHPTIELDTIGIQHYFLEFNNKGQYINDTNIVLDFQVITFMILEIDKVARENGYKISKVIFKIELKKYLFETLQGKDLKQRQIYFAQNLSPIINALHEDHFHIDFEKL